MMQNMERIISHLGEVVPLPLFSFLGSILEEAFAPIPSPVILGAVGTLAYVDGYSIWWLPLLAVIASTGKVLGALVIYFFADKLENIATPFLSRFFAIDHNQVEAIGGKLKGSWRDYTTLIVLRAVPFLPSFIISIACGVVKVNLKVFIVSTYIGSTIRGLIFIVLGYGGYAFVTGLTDGFALTEKIVEIVVVFVVFGILLTLYKKRSKILGSK